MNKLIEFAKEQCEIFPEDSDMGLFLREVIKILKVKSIPLDRIKEVREEIQEYGSRTSNSKQDIAFSACLALIDNLISESEE